MLDSVCLVTSSRAFWQAIWQALLLVAHARIPALTYLSARFDTMAPHAPSRELMLGALAAGLSDGNVLVQRAALDLLIAHLPADTTCVFAAVLVCFS